MNTAEKLREARALIERGWCQDDPAQDANRNLVCETDPDACRFCAFGAMSRVDPLGCADFALTQSARRKGYAGYIAFNDTPGRTQSEVLALFSEAIALAEGS